jgi:hypothetical protein
VLLKQIGAGLIVAGICLNGIVRNACSPYSWCEKYWPIVFFGFFVSGALFGIAGFISSAIERHRNRAKQSSEESETPWLEGLLLEWFRQLRRMRFPGSGL